MAGLLKELMAAGLVEETGGDDSRLTYMEKAAATVGQDLIGKPSHLISAMLAGLDPDIPDDDPSILQADRAFEKAWKTMRNVYPSTPKNMLRAILLDGCERAAAEKAASAILWLTATDTLPLVRLGRQEPVVRRMLDACAKRAEEAALVLPEARATGEKLTLTFDVASAFTAPTAPKMDRHELLRQVAATTSRSYIARNVQPPVREQLPDGNPHLIQNNGQAWANEFSDRMTNVLGDWLDFVAKETLKGVAKAAQDIQNAHTNAVKALTSGFTSQQQWVQQAISASDARQKAEQLRLDAIWWSEALYSTPLRCSYRELPVELAAMVMATDLLSVVTIPAPASVGYLLAETVHRLPGAAFDQKRPLREILVTLRVQCKDLQDAWRKQLSRPPRTGRLSLRDAIVSAIVATDWNADAILAHAGIADDISMSLPVLSRALFRQEQAVRLAGGER